MSRTAWIVSAVLLGMMTCLDVAQAEVRGLLIGVGQYQSSKIRSLKGPQNDLVAMRKLMAAQGAQDVVVLQDDQATRSTVRDAIGGLGQRAQPGDWVVIYYSGHGAQAQARDATEADGLDEFLVLAGFDFDMPDAEQFIIDNDLSAWIGASFGPKVNVLQIADACHSGTLNRGFQAPTDFVERAARDAEGNLILPVIASEATPMSAQSGNLVYIGAAQDEQFALEAPLPTARSESRGLLTYSLERALSDRRDDGHLTADADGDGALSLTELAASLDTQTRRLSRTRQWSSVRLPAANERSVVFKPLSEPPPPVPSPLVRAMDAHALSLLKTSGPWQVAPEAGSAVDLAWQAGAGMVFDGHGDRLAGGVTSLELLRGVIEKRQALALLSRLFDERSIAVSIGPRPRGALYRAGESVALGVKTKGRYLTVFNLASDGAVQRLYPLDGDVEPAKATPAGEVSLARVHATPPFGADQVIAVSSDQPPTLLRAALARTDGTRQPLVIAGALRDQLRQPGFARTSLAIGDLYTAP